MIIMFYTKLKLIIYFLHDNNFYQSQRVSDRSIRSYQIGPCPHYIYNEIPQQSLSHVERSIV